jgi:5-methylcytosine-specific restriction protein A
MPRMTVCTTPGCVELAPVRKAYCDRHAPKPWANPSAHTKSRPKDWHARVNRARRRDRMRCRKCGQPGIQVDHIIEVADGGTWDLDNLQTLCELHHRLKTEESRKARSK